MDVSSRDFAAQASLLLRRAEAGETIVVTDHGRAIAELRPVLAVADGDEAALLDLVRSGLVTAPIRRTTELTPLKLTGPSISAAILEDRQDRF